ncbi:MAG: glucan biosynthesis protein, partial [Pseudomonadota bacterium]
MLVRRSLLLQGCSLLVVGAGGLPAAAGSLPLGAAQPFAFADLVARARANAKRTFRPTVQAPAAVLDAIDYDAHWRIRFDPSASPVLPPDATPVQLFHLGRYAREPVAIHLIEDGWAREVLYTPGAFTMPASSPAKALPSDAGYAGFRLMRPDHGPDWLVFLGASYFRADGPDRQYGLSARGLAIDTGLERPEEFPRFTAFWLGGGEREGESVVVHALLDGPSVTGAYRIGAGHRADGRQRPWVEAR